MFRFPRWLGFSLRAAKVPGAVMERSNRGKNRGLLIPRWLGFGLRVAKAPGQ